MAYVDAMTRVTQIQATLTQLAGRFPAATSATAAAFSGTLEAVAAASPTASAQTGSTTGSVAGSELVDTAQKYLGVPYVFGGKDESGMDCSGLVQRVLKDLGIDAPRTVKDQQKLGTEVASLAEAKPGDLIVTRNSDHIVIYAGNDQIIHAPYAGRAVSLQDNYLKDADILTIRRVVPDTIPGSPARTAELFTARTVPVGGFGAGSGAASGNATTDLIAAARLSLITRNNS